MRERPVDDFPDDFPLESSRPAAGKAGGNGAARPIWMSPRVDRRRATFTSADDASNRIRVAIADAAWRVHAAEEREMGKRFSAGGPMRFGDGESDASDAIQTNLRQSVFAYARELRLRGENPETMLVHVKGAVADATVDVRMGRALFNQIVSWSIEAYFAF